METKNCAFGTLKQFVEDSNFIEGITRAPRDSEILETDRFLGLDRLETFEVTRLVQVYQPNAVLRDRPGLDVYVGSHTPPPGGNYVLANLDSLLTSINEGQYHKRDGVYEAHQRYESLHPYTDGNGRSGRAVWLWMMLKQRKPVTLGFLHHWYYQSLEAFRGR